jgi:hypothetical protein
MFKRQQNELPFGKIVTVSETVFVGLMFKRQQNESPYGKIVTICETILLV